MAPAAHARAWASYKRDANVSRMLAGLIDHAQRYHAELPDHIRRYLNGRGIDDATLDRFLIGWSGWRITIPIFDRDGQLTFFKLAKDPADTSDSPKMLATPGSSVELYGWERVRGDAPLVVVCEGELDRLVLESRRFPAVTSTGGALTFRPAWAEALRAVPEVYVCFDADEAGRIGAERVARLVPHARVVTLPPEVGEGGDVTDFFVRLGMSAEAFRKLLTDAAPLPPVAATRRPPQSAEARDEIDELKAGVRIEDVVARYVDDLAVAGNTLTAPCPFHDDRRPSFVVYPETQTFHCFGCRAGGDVISFIMKAERLDFSDAIELLRRLAA